MSADDDDRMLDRDTRSLPTEERAGEVVLEQVVVALELERVEAFLTRAGAADVEHPAGLGAAFGPLDEEKPCVAELAELVAEVLLERFREEAPAKNVTVPEAAVFDKKPAVDPARRCREGFVGLAGDVSAKCSFDAHRHSHSVPAL